MAARKKLSPALLALTGAALSLPGIARSQTVKDIEIDYRYSNYTEDDISGSDTATGQSSERYEIDTHQFRVASLVDDDYEVSLDLTVESMSGASPWFVLPGANGKPLQVMSGATIEEDRADVLVSVARRTGWGKLGVSLGHSDEDDYQATNIGVFGEWELNDRVSTVSGGIGYSDDQLDPTVGTTPVSTTGADRDTTSAFVGYSRVLGQNTIIQTSLRYADHGGFLSDPYKQAFIQAPAAIVADNRPSGRREFVWLTRLRHFIEPLNAAVHADYRLYDDNWDVTAHTLDLAWHQNLPMQFKVAPGLRWYSQSEAFFYQPFYPVARNDGYASSDYRLSPYGAISFSLDVQKSFNGWSLGARYENYNSGESYAASDVDVEAPALVDFDILSLSLKKIF